MHELSYWVHVTILRADTSNFHDNDIHILLLWLMSG